MVEYNTPTLFMSLKNVSAASTVGGIPHVASMSMPRLFTERAFDDTIVARDNFGREHHFTNFKTTAMQLQDQNYCDRKFDLELEGEHTGWNAYYNMDIEVASFFRMTGEEYGQDGSGALSWWQEPSFYNGLNQLSYKNNSALSNSSQKEADFASKAQSKGGYFTSHGVKDFSQNVRFANQPNQQMMQPNKYYPTPNYYDPCYYDDCSYNCYEPCYNPCPPKPCNEPCPPKPCPQKECFGSNYECGQYFYDECDGIGHVPCEKNWFIKSCCPEDPCNPNCMYDPYFEDYYYGAQYMPCDPCTQNQYPVPYNAELFVVLS